jgi:hypothetical protein
MTRFFAAFTLCCGLTWAQSSFTLEQVLSAPFPAELTVSPGGGVAWVANARGVRNIWVAEPPAVPRP